MSKINFNDYMESAGFGESAILSTGKKTRKVAVKAPNAVAFAESYAFIMADKYRMTIQADRLNRTCRAMAAKGESVEDIKEKVKEGIDKVKKVLVELYDKAIRFFTETVRYWLSNERRLVKALADAKAVVKRSFDENKKDVTVKLPVLNKENADELKKAIEKIEANNGTEAAADLTELIERINKAKDKSDLTEAKEYIDTQISRFKDATERNIKEAEALLETKNRTDEFKGQAAYDELKDTILKLITIFEPLRNGQGQSMKVLNQQIRDFTEEKRKLVKSFKEAGDNSEEAGKKYQKERVIIAAKVKATNITKGLNDKSLGTVLKGLNLAVASFNKVSKA